MENLLISKRGCSVIDYIIVNEKCDIDLVNSFKVEERVDSDHMPLSMELRMEEERGGEEEDEKEPLDVKEIRKQTIVWN